jgi:hypothetical protein
MIDRRDPAFVMKFIHPGASTVEDREPDAASIRFCPALAL